MRLSAVLEASEIVDRHYRDMAVGLYNSILRILEKSLAETGSWPKNLTTLGSKTKHMYVLTIPLDKMPMEFRADLHGAKVVRFVFAEERAVAGGAALGLYSRLAADKSPIIFLSAINVFNAMLYDIGEIPVATVIDQIKKKRNTLIHEIIHWIDDNRFDLEKDSTNLDMGPDGNGFDRSAYYNSNNEWNAHYQELMFMIEEDIRAQKGIFNPDLSDIEKLTSGFGMFYRGIKAMYGKNFGFLRHLNSKTERRFRKRLYNFFQETALPLIYEANGMEG